MQEVMAAHRPHAAARTSPGARPARESGFSVLELIIAIAIMLILLAAAASQFIGAKKSSYAAEAKSAGSAYTQAISQYQADNANMNPPSMTKQGPMDLLKKPYMRSIPDGVAGGRVGFSPNCAPPGGTGLGWVAYCPGTAPNFGIRVQWRGTGSQPWEPGCWMGRTNATPRC